MFEKIELVRQMNLTGIETFLAIAETGQLNRAAEQLNVTQSTVTARLNSLEQTLGQPLFHRRKSGAELTSAGFRFERYAQLLRDTWQQARQETALPSTIQSTFNLGCHSDLWPVFGQPLLHWVHQNQQQVAVSAWSAEQLNLDRWLNNGLIDIALSLVPLSQENRLVFDLAAEELVLVSTTPRALMRWDPEYAYIDSGENFRKSHAEAYPDGETPTLTFGSVILGKDYLLKHGGSGYLPRSLIKAELDDQLLYEVPQAPEFTRSVYLSMNREAVKHWPWLNGAVKHLFDFAIDLS